MKSRLFLVSAMIVIVGIDVYDTSIILS